MTFPKSSTSSANSAASTRRRRAHEEISNGSEEIYPEVETLEFYNVHDMMKLDELKKKGLYEQACRNINKCVAKYHSKYRADPRYINNGEDELVDLYNKRVPLFVYEYYKEKNFVLEDAYNEEEYESKYFSRYKLKASGRNPDEEQRIEPSCDEEFNALHNDFLQSDDEAQVTTMGDVMAIDEEEIVVDIEDDEALKRDLEACNLERSRAKRMCVRDTSKSGIADKHFDAVMKHHNYHAPKSCAEKIHPLITEHKDWFLKNITKARLPGRLCLAGNVRNISFLTREIEREVYEENKYVMDIAPYVRVMKEAYEMIQLEIMHLLLNRAIDTKRHCFSKNFITRVMKPIAKEESAADTVKKGKILNLTRNALLRNRPEFLDNYGYTMHGNFDSAAFILLTLTDMDGPAKCVYAEEIDGMEKRLNATSKMYDPEIAEYDDHYRAFDALKSKQETLSKEDYEKAIITKKRELRKAREVRSLSPDWRDFIHYRERGDDVIGPNAYAPAFEEREAVPNTHFRPAFIESFKHIIFPTTRDACDAYYVQKLKVEGKAVKQRFEMDKHIENLEKYIETHMHIVNHEVLRNILLLSSGAHEAFALIRLTLFEVYTEMMDVLKKYDVDEDGDPIYDMFDKKSVFKLINKHRTKTVIENKLHQIRKTVNACPDDLFDMLVANRKRREFHCSYKLRALSGWHEDHRELCMVLFDRTRVPGMRRFGAEFRHLFNDYNILNDEDPQNVIRKKNITQLVKFYRSGNLEKYKILPTKCRGSLVQPELDEIIFSDTNSKGLDYSLKRAVAAQVGRRLYKEYQGVHTAFKGVVWLIQEYEQYKEVLMPRIPFKAERHAKI